MDMRGQLQSLVSFPLQERAPDKTLGMMLSRTQTGHSGQEKIPAPVRNEDLVIQPVANHFNDLHILANFLL
jgi:hypothetical protein